MAKFNRSEGGCHIIVWQGRATGYDIRNASQQEMALAWVFCRLWAFLLSNFFARACHTSKQNADMIRFLSVGECVSKCIEFEET
jgi:hypothetical protein